MLRVCPYVVPPLFLYLQLKSRTLSDKNELGYLYIAAGESLAKSQSGPLPRSQALARTQT